jgi:hypothetical protein
MISFIQGPHYDEPLFSTLARIYDGLIGPSRSQFARHLFGNDRMIIPYDFPCCIDAIAQRIGQRVGLAAEDLIHRHTMFPIAAFLMSAEQAQRVKMAMRGDRAVAMNLLKWHRNRAGSGVRRLNFCTKCRERDVRRFGYTWWRRSHQVPGVVCCHQHTTPLEISQFIPGQFWKLDYPVADKAASVGHMPTPDGIDIMYARDVHWILSTASQPIDPDRLKQLYNVQLNKLGLLRGIQLKRSEFLCRFFAQRSKSKWTERYLGFDPKDASAWPAQTVKAKANHRSSRMHLLVMRFLGLSIDELTENINDMGMCIVDASPPTERYLRDRIRERWLDPSWTTNRIKKDLRIGVTRLLNLAHKEGLPIPRMPGTRRAKAFLAKRKICRAVISRSMQRRADSEWRTAVRWLGRNDRHWLREQLKRTQRPKVMIVDWEARQNDYISRLPQLAARIRAERPFRRVCAAAFVSFLPFGASMGPKLRQRMPQLASEMKQMTETNDEFTLRRVRVVRQLNPDLPPFAVREKASVARTCRNPVILAAIGYRLVGTRWVSADNSDHPLYGIAVATGPERNAHHLSSRRISG